MAEEPALTTPVASLSTATSAAAEAPTRQQWEQISRRLQEPFDPREVDFRVQGKVNEQTGRAQVVAYIDARAVQDRLDAVVGAGNWSFDWTPLVIDRGEVQVAKGVLTVYGVSKADAGSASSFEQTLGAVSHCFKRAAVHWGIGRYLYSLPTTWVAVERGGRIPEPVLDDLRSRLPRPSASGSSTPTEPALPERRPEPAVVRANGPTRPAATQRQSVAASHQERHTVVAPAPSGDAAREQSASEQQLNSLRKLCQALDKPDPKPGLTHAEAGQLIVQFSAEYQRLRKAS
jgi:hypothetical protein